jgi:tetratricopeptide (TPR) repeat protein
MHDRVKATVVAERMMRTDCLIVAAVVLNLFLQPALAATKKDIADCQQTKDWDRQIAGCTRILNTKGLPNQARASVLAARGYGRLQKADFDRAIADADEAIRLDPKFAHGYTVRGTAHYSKGQFDAAIRELTASIRLDSKQPVAYDRRGAAWFYKGDYDRAIADYSEAIRINPKDGFVYANRGEAWRFKGDLERALADQDEAIRIAPKSSDSYVLRGDTLRYKGDFERAIADYDQALRVLTASAAPALTGRGLTYERIGDPARARIDFEKAVAASSEQSEITVRTARETALARLAALDSGAAPPVIPPVPVKLASTHSIPTPAPATPRVAPDTVKQGRRIALIIGNAAYKNVPALANPPRDAEAIAASLRAVGFETVRLAADGSRDKLVDALRAFGSESEQAEWAVVYYAGHGIEVNGMNYLIPVDAKLATDRDVQFEAVPLDQVMAAVEGARKLKVIMLDACRDNPFTPQMRRTASPDAVAASSTAGGAFGTRSIGRGLAEVKVSGATLVVYAAKHGQTALDGEGGNSPFAVAVVQRIATPNVEINKIFRLVRDDVMEATAGRQEPYTYGSLPGREDFFFVAK